MLSQESENTGALHLKDGLFLGFCAILIVGTKLIFRWHLNISGHSMLFTMFFLLLARTAVSYKMAASMTGLLSGLATLMLGMGKGGPLILIKFIIPALVVDGAFLIYPLITCSYFGCLLVGILASASKFISTVFVDWAVGMDTRVLLYHALLKSLGAVIFGALGSLMVPPVVKKLRSHGII